MELSIILPQTKHEKFSTSSERQQFSVASQTTFYTKDFVAGYTK